MISAMMNTKSFISQIQLEKRFMWYMGVYIIFMSWLMGRQNKLDGEIFQVIMLVWKLSALSYLTSILQGQSNSDHNVYISYLVPNFSLYICIACSAYVDKTMC